jgi:hypothetical protein
MEHLINFERRTGVDLGYYGRMDLYPKDVDCRVGKRGIDKSYTLVKMIEIAYKMEEKPNIIIKSGKNAKWYLKKIAKEELESEIVKHQNCKNNNTSRCTMYILEWESPISNVHV